MKLSENCKCLGVITIIDKENCQRFLYTELRLEKMTLTVSLQKYQGQRVS